MKFDHIANGKGFIQYGNKVLTVTERPKKCEKCPSNTYWMATNGLHYCSEECFSRRYITP